MLVELPGKSVVGGGNPILPADFPKGRVTDLGVPGSIGISRNRGRANLVGDHPQQVIHSTGYGTHRNHSTSGGIILLHLLGTVLHLYIIMPARIVRCGGVAQGGIHNRFHQVAIAIIDVLRVLQRFRGRFGRNGCGSRGRRWAGRRGRRG